MKARQPKPHNLVYLHRDRGYRFTERDPQMVELCDLIHKSEMSINQIVTEISKATGGAYNLGHSTIANWLNGKTRRPQNITMTWVAYSIGYERRWVKL